MTDGLLQALIDKMPVFDPSWPEATQELWWNAAHTLTETVCMMKREAARAERERNSPWLDEFGPIIKTV